MELRLITTDSRWRKLTSVMLISLMTVILVTTVGAITLNQISQRTHQSIIDGGVLYGVSDIYVKNTTMGATESDIQYYTLNVTTTATNVKLIIIPDASDVPIMQNFFDSYNITVVEHGIGTIIGTINMLNSASKIEYTYTTTGSWKYDYQYNWKVKDSVVSTDLQFDVTAKLDR